MELGEHIEISAFVKGSFSLQLQRKITTSKGTRSGVPTQALHALSLFSNLTIFEQIIVRGKKIKISTSACIGLTDLNGAWAAFLVTKEDYHFSNMSGNEKHYLFGSFICLLPIPSPLSY